LLHPGHVTDPLVTIGNTVAMCTRRLRIVDASNGVQPQTSFDGRFLVSSNGEIYNHVALRDQLETLSARSTAFEFFLRRLIVSDVRNARPPTE
jgi:asparagine synthetase B (glutamine-hydrolysing)